MSELDILRQRRELVLLSCDLQRATLTRRLGRIEASPMSLVVGAAAKAASKPRVLKLGIAAVGLAVRAYRKRRARKLSRARLKWIPFNR